MNLILLGAPGAGKGTQAEKISAKWNIPAVSTGDIFRSEIKNETELGKLAKSYIDRGDLVPDEVTIRIVKEYLSSDLCRNGFILDGFPRSLNQAEALDSMGIRIDAALSIEVPDETIVSRLGGRRICTECAATYHVLFNPPKATDVCDKCGAPLYIRSDDAPDTVLNRLKNYHQMAQPIKAYYAAKGCLITVEGQERVEDTTALVFASLEKFDV